MGLIDIGQLPNLDTFGIFTCHLCFAAWAQLDAIAIAFSFYSLVLLFVLLWCIKDTQSEIPLVLAIRVNIVCIIFDLWIFIDCFRYSYIGVFVLFGRVLNFFLRFITIPLLSKMCSDKTGGINDGIPSFLAPIFGTDQNTPGRDPYENIDNIPHQSYPKSEPSMSQTASYSFTSNVPTYQA